MERGRIIINVFIALGAAIAGQQWPLVITTVEDFDLSFMNEYEQRNDRSRLVNALSAIFISPTLQRAPNTLAYRLLMLC